MPKRKKIILVPHTHWDREWYFSEETSNVLLINTIDELIQKCDEEKMFLDGQWSLIDEYVKLKSLKTNEIKKLLNKNSISSGPLYSQSDVFNTQAETIFRNFEIGNQIANGLGVKQNKTVYMPDTFGFNSSLPQIFRKLGYEYFVFWRGASKTLIDSSPFFIWKGIDGSEIKSYCLKDGYFSLGAHYPYNDEKSGKKNDPNYFSEKLRCRVANLNVKDDEVILPLGGDQAPFIHNQLKFLSQVSPIIGSEIVVYESFDVPLNNIDWSNKPVYQGGLKEPVHAKIHRTIGGSRYDIKKMFRVAEDKLYYLLEPLEVYYSKYSDLAEFNKYVDEHIIKKLLIASTHDSLGACNTDSTNRFALDRISKIIENEESIVDLWIKKIILHEQIQDDSLIIFNPSPFENTLFERKTIYSRHNETTNVKTTDFELITMESVNISLNPEKTLFKQDVLLFKRNSNPLSLEVFDISKQNATPTLNDDDYVEINENWINVNLGGKIHRMTFELEEDLGDSYDFSPGKKLPVELSLKIAKTYKLHGNVYYLLQGMLNGSEVEINVFIQNENLDIKMEISNKLKNTKVSLIIGETGVIEKAHYLSITPIFEQEKYQGNWRDHYHEYPVDVDSNDCLITIGDTNIYTSGTNEFFKNDYGVKLTLYRTYNFVTNKDMEWRPSTSGLSWYEESSDSQLQKKLTFDFRLSTNNRIKNLNSFKYRMYSYKVQHSNFIANKMTKFAINDIQKKSNESKIKKINFSGDDVFISSVRKIDDQLQFRIANMENKNKTVTVQVNNTEQTITLKPYEIKEAVIKGVL